MINSHLTYTLPCFLPENDLSLNLAKKIGLESGILAWKLLLPVSSSISPLKRASDPLKKKTKKTKTKILPLQPFRSIGSISLHSLLGGVFDAVAFVYKNEQGTENAERKTIPRTFSFFNFLFIFISLCGCFVYMFVCGNLVFMEATRG